MVRWSPPFAQPRQSFGGEFAHEFPFGMAAAYCYHLAMCHAFRDGNKRTAFAAVVVFLRMNGWNFELPDEHAADLMLEMIAKHRDKAWLAEKVAAVSRARPSLELRDFFAGMTDERLTPAILGLLPANVPKMESGFLARVRECEPSMPAIEGLARQQATAQAASDSEWWTKATIAAVVLLAIHALAEEDGYEW